MAALNDECGIKQVHKALKGWRLLEGLVAGLASENAALRHQLAMAGHPAPPPFAPPPAAPCTPGVMPVHQAPPYTPWQFPGVSYMPPTPKVC